MVEATHAIMNKGVEVWQSDFHSNEWFQVGYPMVVIGYLVGQLALGSEDMKLTRSPEKFWPKEKQPEEIKEKKMNHPLQGTFILQSAWDNKIKV